MILVSEPVLAYDPSENDRMVIDSPPSSPTKPILGMPSPHNRRRRPRYSYPVSTTEWTEYISPLKSPQVDFYIDSTGDRSWQSSMYYHEPLICRNKICLHQQMLLKLVFPARLAGPTRQLILCRRPNRPRVKQVPYPQTTSHSHQNRNMF